MPDQDQSNITEQMLRFYFEGDLKFVFGVSVLRISRETLKTVAPVHVFKDESTSSVESEDTRQMLNLSKQNL